MPTLNLERGVLDLATGELRAEDGPVQLTDIERKLIAWLAERPGEAVSREALQKAVWGYAEGVLTRTVFTTVGRVRRKLERDPSRPRHLVTVPGEGYALCVAPAAPASSPARLPESPLPLVGRGGELATLRAALDGGARLLTLHGPGGVGKTRLAIELARAEPGPCRFVALEACADAGELPSAVARAVGVELGRGPDPLGELLAELGDEAWLLVLDNAEHLLPGVALSIERLLAAPRLRLLVTSRRRLGLRSEHVLGVDDLELPVDGVSLAEADAGRLLLRVVERVRLGWTPSASERDALARICARVGGSPLALELAASWLRVLNPGEIEEELSRSDALLRAEDADRPTRHRSIAVALQASWRLLDGRAAEALQRLSTLHGAFDRGLAAELAGTDLLILGQLVDAAMLRREAHGFGLHPLVRRDARRRLALDPARAADAEARHADVVLGRVEAAARAGRGFGELAPLRADVVLAWRHRVGAGALDALATALPAALACLEALLPAAACIELLEDSACRLEASGPSAGAWVAALRLLGLGAGAPIPEAFAASVERAATLGGPVAVLALCHGAIGSHQAGAPAQGLAWALQAAALADALPPEPYLRAFPRGVAGSLLLRLGRLDEARARLLEAVALGGRGPGASRSRVHLGQVELARGDFERARETLAAAIVQLRADGDRAFLVMALTALAQAEQAAGADPEPILAEAVEEAERSRLPPVWAAAARVGLAALAVEAGDRRRAAACLEGVDPAWLVFPPERAAHARVVEALAAASPPDP